MPHGLDDLLYSFLKNIIKELENKSSSSLTVHTNNKNINKNIFCFKSFEPNKLQNMLCENSKDNQLLAKQHAEEFQKR